MKTKTKPFSLNELNKLKEKTNTRSDYQRLGVWRRAQKQLLIDSILRGYDIPKIYFKEEDASSQYVYEVIDGQQRLHAIWEYFDGKFALPINAEKIDGEKCASQFYEELHPSLRKQFDHYEIDIVFVTEAIQTEETDEIGELFLRLQNGTPLNSQEKRNAMPGKMRKFVKELTEEEKDKEKKKKREFNKHPFFESVAFNNTRYAHAQKAAQLICLELSLEKSQFCNIRTGDLDKMYKEQNNFDTNGKTAKHFIKTLDYLNKAFPSRTLQLAHHNIIILYCLASTLIKFYNYEGTEQNFHDWFIEFESERKTNEGLEDNQKDASLLTYSKAITKAADGQVSIEIRFKFMQERFFSAMPNITKK